MLSDQSGCFSVGKHLHLGNKLHSPCAHIVTGRKSKITTLSRFNMLFWRHTVNFINLFQNTKFHLCAAFLFVCMFCQVCSNCYQFNRRKPWTICSPWVLNVPSDSKHFRFLILSLTWKKNVGYQCFIFTLDSSTGGIFTLAVIILNDQQQTSGVSQNCLMGFQGARLPVRVWLGLLQRALALIKSWVC